MQVQKLFNNLLNHPKTVSKFGLYPPNHIANWKIQVEEISSGVYTHRVHIVYQIKLDHLHLKEDWDFSEEEYQLQKVCRKFVKGFARALYRRHGEGVLEFTPELQCPYGQGSADIKINKT